MKIFNDPQGSAEWHAHRLGIPTASQFHCIITPTGQYSQSKATKTYLYKLLCERILKQPMGDDIGNFRWPAHGTREEPDAARQFEIVTGLELEPIGFVTTDDGRIGCSPDRKIRKRAETVEIKCPAPWTHLMYTMEGPGNDYIPQVQGQLLVTGFEAVHFYSYYRDFSPFLQVTLPQKHFQGLMAGALHRFCDELDALTERARSMGLAAALEAVGPDIIASPQSSGALR